MGDTEMTPAEAAEKIAKLAYDFVELMCHAARVVGREDFDATFLADDAHDFLDALAGDDEALDAALGAVEQAVYYWDEQEALMYGNWLAWRKVREAVKDLKKVRTPSEVKR